METKTEPKGQKEARRKKLKINDFVAPKDQATIKLYTLVCLVNLKKKVECISGCTYEM